MQICKSPCVVQIRELEDRKKIQTLLMLSGLTESEVSYFMKEPPAFAIVEQKLPVKLKNALQNDAASKRKSSLARNCRGRLVLIRPLFSCV